MPNSELAYFDGHYVAHIALWDEQQRWKRIRVASAKAHERRTNRR